MIKVSSFLSDGNCFAGLPGHGLSTTALNPPLFTVLSLVNAQTIMHITFQLRDILWFDSTVVIYVFINMSSPKLNNQIF